MTGTERGLAWTQLHLAVLLAGGAGLFAKALPVSPLQLTAGRTAFGALALLALAAARRRSPWIADARERAWVLAGGLVLALHWFTFFAAIHASSVAVGLLAFASFPVFVAVFEPLAGGPRPSRAQWVDTALVVAGLVLVTPRLSLDEGATVGLLWGLASAATYALLALMSRRAVARLPATAVTLHQQVAAALACALALGLLESAALQGLAPSTWGGLVLLGVVFTALGQSLVVASLRALPAHTVALLFGLEPVYGIALAWALLGEAPTPRMLAGGVLVLAAVARAQRRTMAA